MRQKFPLVLMGGRAEGLACADPGARTPIGASGNWSKRLVVILQTSASKIFAGVDGGLSGGASVRRPGSEDPHQRQQKFISPPQGMSRMHLSLCLIMAKDIFVWNLNLY